MARERVAHRVSRDVVLWCLVLGALVLGAALLNGPREAVYEPGLRRWVFSPPPLPLLPSSIVPGAGKPFFSGVVCGLSAAVAIRCALPRGQRLLALLGLGALAGLLALGAALTAWVQGAAPTLNWLGGAFGAGTLWLLCACVLFGVAAEAFLEGHIKTLIWALSAGALNLIGLLALAPVSLLALLAPALVVYGCFAGVAVRGSGRYPRMLWGCVLVLPPIFAAGLGLVFRPGGVLALGGPESWGAAMDAFWKQWVFRAGLAFRVLEAEPMLGTGADGFAQMAPFFLKGRAWALWRAGGTGVPCDLFALLAARGLLGTVILLLPGVAMLGRCVVRWVAFCQARRRSYSVRYVFVLIGSVMGVAGVLAASVFGAPLQAPAVLGAFLMVCACMGGWMPRAR